MEKALGEDGDGEAIKTRIIKTRRATASAHDETSAADFPSCYLYMRAYFSHRLTFHLFSTPRGSK